MTRIFQIALTTYRESIRSKILYAILVFALLLVLVSTLFGTVTIGDQVKVIKDAGLLAISIFSVLFAAISGGALLFKELSRKTIYNILAKPVHRWEFLCGKFLGMVMTVTVMIGLMGLGLSLFVFCFEGRFDPLLWEAYLYTVLELIVVCAAAIFFSAIVVTPLLSGLFTVGIFIAGRSSDYVLYFVEKGDIAPVGRIVLKGLYWVLPHLEMLNIGNQAVYGQSLGLTHLLWSTIYIAGYSAVLLVLASLAFKRREFN